MNEKLEAIAAVAAEDLAAFVKEKEEEILEAWSAAEEEAQEQENKPKLRIGFSITLDLDKGHQENAMTFGIRRKVSRTLEIPDPNQEELAAPVGRKSK